MKITLNLRYEICLYYFRKIPVRTVPFLYRVIESCFAGMLYYSLIVKARRVWRRFFLYIFLSLDRNCLQFFFCTNICIRGEVDWWLSTGIVKWACRFQIPVLRSFSHRRRCFMYFVACPVFFSRRKSLFSPQYNSVEWRIKINRSLFLKRTP